MKTSHTIAITMILFFIVVVILYVVKPDENKSTGLSPEEFQEQYDARAEQPPYWTPQEGKDKG